MRILVDADACPVKDEIVSIGRKYKIEVHYFVDVNHILNSDYAVVHTVDQGADSVDLHLINFLETGDLVITQDYGVATMVIGKKGYVIQASGRELNKDNIDLLMFERHIAREQRTKRGKSGPKHKKRVQKDNVIFKQALETLVKTHI